MANTVIGASVDIQFASVGELRKMLQEATQKAKELKNQFGETSEEFINAQENVNKLKTTLDGLNLKSKLKEANLELTAMQDQFGATSQQAIAAARKVADLKDRIEDARETADLFDPGKKFEAFVTIGSQVAAGFSAVQGAMALVGAESEDVQKSLMKVQSAMAIAQGLSQLRDFGKSWQALNLFVKSNSILIRANAAATAAAGAIMKLFGVAVNTTSFAFKALKTAIISTGIGALIILIVEVIQWISSWTSSTDEQAEANEQLRKREDELEYTIESTNKSIEKRNKLQQYSTELALANAKAVGASAEQLRKIEADAAADRTKNAEKNEIEAQNELNRIAKRTDATAKELYLALQNYKDKITAREEAVMEENLLLANQRVSIFQEEKSSNDKLIQEQQRKDEKIKQLTEKAFDLQKQIVNDLEKFNFSAQQKELFDLENKFEEQKKTLIEGGQSTVQLTELYEKQRQEIIDKYAKEEKKKREDFLKDINKLTTEIRLLGEKDSREKERAQLAISYAEQLAAIKNNENYNALEKLRLRNVLLTKQKLEEDALNEKFRQEDAKRQKIAHENTLKMVKEQNDALIDAEINLQNKRYEAATAGLSLLESLAGENEKIANAIFAVQKGLEIARIVTDTARGIVAAKAGLAAVPPFLGAFPNPAFILAAASAAKQITGLKIAAAVSIAQIAAASINKFKKGSGSTPGGGGPGPAPAPPPPGTTAPLTPAISPAVQGQMLNADAINNLGNTAIRAYVMNSDIQNNDQQNAYLQRNARIG